MTIQDFLRQHGIDYREGGSHRHVRAGWIGIDCPRCGQGTGKFHAGIELSTGRAACWKCGGFNSMKLLAEAAGIDWNAVQKTGISFLSGVDAPRIDFKPGRGLEYPKGLTSLQKPHRAYLKRRGFDPDSIETLWGIQSTGPLSSLAWRIWIPIELGGRVVSWTTRAIGERNPKYLSASPEQELVNHKTVLYGEDLAGHALLVVEGPTDVWAVGPGAVATLGLKVTPQQIERMGNHPMRAICFDSDARRQAEALADVLQQYPGETHVVQLETGDDLADADEDEIGEIRKAFLE